MITATTSSGSANMSSLFPVGTYIYLGTDYESNFAVSGTTTLTIPVDRGFGTVIEHSINSILKKSTDEPIGGGAWGKVYMSSLILVDYAENETLPHTRYSFRYSYSSRRTVFEDVDVKFNTASAFRKNEKGIRIYTRIQDSNERFIFC